MLRVQLDILTGAVAAGGKVDMRRHPGGRLHDAVAEARTLRFNRRIDRVEHVAGMELQPL